MTNYQSADRGANPVDPAITRTLTPIIVGVIAAWLLNRWGIELPGEPAAEAVAGFISALYYIAVHWIEKHVPGASKALGSARQPVEYGKPDAGK